MTYSLTEAGSSTITTAVITFSTVDGSLIVSTSDLANDGFSKSMVVTVTSTDSIGGSNTLTDTFVLTLQDVCKSTVLTAPNFATASYPSENLWTAMSFTFTALSESVGTCGAVTYTFKNTDTAQQTATDGVFSLSGLAFGGTATTITPWVGTHTFYVTATLDNYTTKTIDSNQISVTIGNPCTSTTITDTQTITNLATTVKGDSDSTTFTAYTDSVSTASAAFGANNCGVPTYEIKMSDGTTAVPGYLTLSGTALTATTTDPTHIGVHNIQL